jgi:hypothetical protein
MPDSTRLGPATLILIAALAWPWGGLWAGEPGLFDGHIHYNRDAWEVIDPASALDRLSAAGIERAVVSSTPTEGTERLYELAPERIVPLLRPYRSPADRRDWFADPELAQRLRTRLDAFPYAGIGEFHVFGSNASTAPMAAMIALARERGLFLQAHADTEAIRRILAQAPDVTLIWAHAGFDVPLETLSDLLDRHPRLYLELSFRNDVAPLGRLSEGWRQLFLRHPDRILVGMDTYIPSRWAELNQLADDARGWLAQLPPDVAQAVAFENAERLLAGWRSRGRD